MQAVFNRSLHRAKRVKNDEFYTRLDDIRIGLKPYQDYFRGKSVYCNCDDPKWSQFWAYFESNFNSLGLRKLTATYYSQTCSPYKHEILTDQNGRRQHRVSALSGDGDFRSDECVACLLDADIVVTNPPFSLFREHLLQAIRNNRDVILVGPVYGVLSMPIFPLIQSYVLRIDAVHAPHWFIVPDDSALIGGHSYKMVNSDHFIRMGNVVWYSTVPRSDRDGIQLVQKYADRQDKYPTYDNDAAVHVDCVKDIPADYSGVMGVPVTFLAHFNPKQFRVVGMRYGRDGKDITLRGKALFGRILIQRLACDT